MESVAVVGLGSIGTIFAAHLLSAGRHRVTCCVRSSVGKLTVIGEYGSIEANPVCVTDPSTAKPVDWVLLAVKSQDTNATEPWLNRLCASATKVVMLQNGVDQESRVAPFVSAATVIPTVVLANGRKISPHCIRHLTPVDDLLVPPTPDGHAFVTIFEGSLLRIRAEPDFLTASWQKFLANLVANPLTALTGRNIEVLRNGDMEQLALGILREAAQVAVAVGANLPQDAAERTMQWMARYPGETGTSMLQDRKDGKPLEIDALTGTLIRLAEERNIPTPLNRAICALLLSIY